jgi:hypothetical protein
MAKMRWNFPSTNGGMEYVQDPSSAHFIEAPVSNLVREVIQNSLDARYDGLDKPVRVEFAEIYIDKSRIGGCELEQHVRACHERAEEKNRTAVVEIYQRALEVLEQAQVRCLMIQDTGTTGLKGNLWDSLVREEGAVSKFGDNPGGNYGIGKNAVLNVSDLRTVFYSTRYIGRDSGNKGRVRGRIDKLQGKSTLMTHPDPNDPGDMVQHIGFYADEAGQPLVGARNIPKTFRLDDTGTGVFILGFNPRSDDWVMEIARAAAENFFYAIHNKDLVISVKPADGQEDIEIVHDTLEDLLENCDAKYYYRAIRDSMPRQTPKIDNLGALNAYVRFDKNAPRRVGYINRNGMLITDSREQKSNPLAPRGNSFWLDYAVMVMPATAEGDMWIRQIENPSHTALSAEQLPDKDAIRAAQRTFLEARRALTKIIDDESGINEPSELSNVEELARFFPKEDSSTKEEVLKVRSIERPRQATRLADPDGLEDESDAGDEYEGSVASITSASNDSAESSAEGSVEIKGSTGNQSRLSRYVLNNVRVIPRSSTECYIAFTPESEDDAEISLPLIPAGADVHPGKDPNRSRKVEVVNAEAANDTDADIYIEDGEIRIKPQSASRVVIRVETDSSLDGYAFSLTR